VSAEADDLRAEVAALRDCMDVIVGIAAAALWAEGLPVPPELGFGRPGDYGYPQPRPRHLSLVPPAAPGAEAGR
jgi:hypothetical protein